MNIERFLLIIPVTISLLAYILVYLVIEHFMHSYFPFHIFGLKEGIVLFTGALCMLAFIALKKEKMGWNKTTITWTIFVTLYALVAILTINPKAWGPLFYITMAPFLSDRIANRPYRKFDATKL